MVNIISNITSQARVPVCLSCGLNFVYSVIFLLPQKWMWRLEALPGNGIRYVRSWRLPFCALSIPRTHISAFSVLKTLVLFTIHIFLEILSSKASEFVKSSVPKPQIYFVKKFISLESQIQQWFVHKPPVQPIGAFFVAHLYQNESWVPPVWSHIRNTFWVILIYSPVMLQQLAVKTWLVCHAD